MTDVAARHASMNGQTFPQQRSAGGRTGANKVVPKRWYQRLHEPEAVGTIFYSGLLITALLGSVSAASHWMKLPFFLVIGPVALLEVGGVYLSSMADARRRLGEAATAARLLSIAFACGAATLNWVGHEDRIQAGFFAGISIGGYAVWLIRSGQRRRDQLRAEGRLPAAPPAYGARWLSSPRKTWAARQLAKANPGMGLYESIQAIELYPKIKPLLHKKLVEIHGAEQAAAIMALMDAGEMMEMIRKLLNFQGFAEVVATQINTATVNTRANAQRAAVAATVKAAAPAVGRPGRTITRGRRPGERRSSRETYELYQQIKAQMPDAQEQDYARQLGIGPRALRKVIQKIEQGIGEDTGEHAVVSMTTAAAAAA